MVYLYPHLPPHKDKECKSYLPGCVLFFNLIIGNKRDWFIFIIDKEVNK